MTVGWRLRRADGNDVTALHRLVSELPVFRYIFDGQAPTASWVQGWVDASAESFRDHRIGIWVLSGSEAGCGGFVSLSLREGGPEAELACALAPRLWGRGLATRMAASAIQRAFSIPEIKCIVAGADGSNNASIALVRRLGMRFRRVVDYPLGPGIEYELGRGELVSIQSVELIPMLDD